MKKKILTMCISVLTVATLVGCGKTETGDVAKETETVAEVEETVEAEVVEAIETETPHEHSFTETITKEATCLEAGEKILACECGESSVEEVPATGHDFSNYVSNEDATYTADGTETATCTCGETDTRVAEGSMLIYTFEDMDATKYAKSTVNVRALPNTDGEKLGGLSTNDEVKVTGKCAETGWYRIEYSDGIAYVSDEYLVDEKVEVQASAPAASSEPFPYELFKVYDEGGVYVYYYIYADRALDVPEERARCDRERNSILLSRYPNYQWSSPWAGEMVSYAGVKYEKRYCATLYDADKNVIVSW